MLDSVLFIRSVKLRSPARLDGPGARSLGLAFDLVSVSHRSPLRTTITHSKALITHIQGSGKLFKARMLKKFENLRSAGFARPKEPIICNKPGYQLF